LNENLDGINRMTKIKELILVVRKHIKIITKPHYVPSRSSPIQSYFLFSYSIRIHNQSDEAIKLISRYWHITDGSGFFEDIYGPGVVGKKPTIKPSTFFEYKSFCPLRTPVGSMRGTYGMVNEKGEEFDVQVDKFRLIASQVLN